MKELAIVILLMKELAVTLFLEENEMLGMLHNLQAPIEHVEEMKKGLENDMSLNR